MPESAAAVATGLVAGLASESTAATLGRAARSERIPAAPALDDGRNDGGGGHRRYHRLHHHAPPQAPTHFRQVSAFAYLGKSWWE